MLKMPKMKDAARSNAYTYGLVIAVFIVVQLLIKTGHVSSSLQGQLVPICAYVIMAVSLNLTVGILGELSIGHAGFMSIGAFAGVVAAISLETIIPFTLLRVTLSLLTGAFCAGVAGALIGVPVLRLKGDYLAIVTLAFGEIIKNIINCLYLGVDKLGLHFSFLTDADHLNLGEGGRVLIDGPLGITGIPKLSTFTMGIVLILITLFVVLNLIESRSGRAIMALRDNRIAAESVGIHVTKYKLMAFVISAALAGAAGTLFAMNFSTIIASKFGFNTSILILVFVVLGGLGNIRGSIIVAAVLTVLPELLRQFNDYRMLLYAAVLILMMIATNNDVIKGYLSTFKEKLLPAVLRKNRKGAENG